MAFPNYTISGDIPGDNVYNSDLHAEIIAAGPYATNFIGVTVTPDDDAITIVFDAEPSAEDITAVEAVLAAHDHTLVQAKANKIAAIDSRTEQLIGAGFVYAAKNMSLSLAAQSKMTAAHQIKDHVAFTYPVKWNTKTDDDAYEITDAADMDGFYLTAIGTIRARLDSGTTLKDGVRAATTVAEVEAVIDNR